MLKIKRSLKPVIEASIPEFTVGETLGTIAVGSGANKEFELTLNDTYKNLNDTATGYTFKWKTEGEEDQIVENVTKDSYGKFVASAKFHTISDGKELTLQVTAPNGKRITRSVKTSV